MKLKRLKQPFVLFLILTLGIGIMATGVTAQDGFGGDSDEQQSQQSPSSDSGSQNDFGGDSDDSQQTTDDGSSDGTSSDTESTSTSSSNTESDDSGSSRSGFGDDTDDEGPSGSDSQDSDTGSTSTSDSSSDSSSSSSSTDSSSRDGFGDDTDDSGSSQKNYGDDTDDSGSSRNGTGDDTDDAGSSRDGFGEDSDDEGPKGYEEEQSQSSLEASISPSAVAPGEEVQVTGTVEGSDSEVVVRMDGQRVASATPNSNGAFQASFTPEETGQHTVTVAAGDMSEQFTLQVQDDVEIVSSTFPESVRTGESFQVCADVSSQTTPEVTLYKDGQAVNSKNNQGVVCFTTTLQESGDHQLRIEAAVDGDSARTSATVNAYTTGTGGGGDGGDGGGVGVDDTQNQGALGQFMSSMSANILLVIGSLLAAIGAALGLRKYR